MEIKIIAKSVNCETALKKLILDSKSKSAKILGKVKVINTGPFTISLQPLGLQKVPDSFKKAMPSVLNTISTAICDMMKDYGAESNEYEVK